MKVSELINYIRVELTDTQSTRWSDDKILSLIRMAFVRVSNLVFRNQIEFLRSIENYDLVVNQSEYDLPFDFMVPSSIFFNNTKLTHLNPDQFETIIATAPVSCFMISGDKLIIKDIPTTSGTLKMYYYVKINPEEIIYDPKTGKDYDTPFDGRLDFPIKEYVTLRAKNIKENDTSVEMQLLQDFETAVLETYATLDPVVVKTRGWMT